MHTHQPPTINQIVHSFSNGWVCVYSPKNRCCRCFPMSSTQSHRFKCTRNPFLFLHRIPTHSNDHTLKRKCAMAPKLPYGLCAARSVLLRFCFGKCLPSSPMPARALTFGINVVLSAWRPARTNTHLCFFKKFRMQCAHSLRRRTWKWIETAPQKPPSTCQRARSELLRGS